MFLKEFLEFFNHHFTLLVIFPAILSVGCYLTIKLRCVQLTQLKNSLIYLCKSGQNDQGTISRFGAISAVLAGNFGTGNISGMAVAIATGGPGALVWMWVMAFFGAAIQYASCVLGMSFRHKTNRGDYVGGPMYYLRDGLGFKKLGSFFAIVTLFGAVTVGNFAQINSIILPLQAMGCNPLYGSLLIATLVGVVIIGGIQRLARFAAFIVPFKALLYLGTAATIIALHSDQLASAISLMFHHAFGLEQVAGGVMGIGVLKAMTTGFDRGLFATDAGTGIVPILQANTRSEQPVIEGVATLLAPLMVMIVCTATGLVLILTGAWQQPHLQSTNMVIYAFSQGLHSPVGGLIVFAALVLFAYTTILAWAYCGEKALEFLVGSEKRSWFRGIFILLLPIGSFFQVDLIWILADISITFMLCINLIGIIGLSHRVIAPTTSKIKEFIVS